MGTYVNISDVEIDHPFRVGADGVVSDAGMQIHGPSVYEEGLSVMIEDPAWEAYSQGYTGQYGYNGPVMHPSEYMGGRLESDILADPGVYVVTTVSSLDHTDGDDVTGWIVCKLKGSGE